MFVLSSGHFSLDSTHQTLSFLNSCSFLKIYCALLCFPFKQLGRLAFTFCTHITWMQSLDETSFFSFVGAFSKNNINIKNASGFTPGLFFPEGANVVFRECLVTFWFLVRNFQKQVLQLEPWLLSAALMKSDEDMNLWIALESFTVLSGEDATEQTTIRTAPLFNWELNQIPVIFYNKSTVAVYWGRDWSFSQSMGKGKKAQKLGSTESTEVVCICKTIF